MAGMATKNLLSGTNQGPSFDVGMGADLKQQLLDEEEQRANQMKGAKNSATMFGGSAGLNMASVSLLGAGSGVR